MSPHKQPCSLFQLCVKSSIRLINSACYVIEKTYPENQLHECEREAFDLKCQLMMMLPVRLFDVLCSERRCCQYRGDPRIQLQVLTHPNMTVFRCNRDSDIAQRFWIATLSTLSRLVVLDLKFVCTDEILKVIGDSCPLLEDLNIVTRLEICESLSHDNIVLTRNVSDKGLYFIRNLKQLRILAMDPPEKMGKKYSFHIRFVTQAGIMMLISKLPYLEELRIESCDIGSTLIGSAMDIGPLRFRKINCTLASTEGLMKLIKMCPFLNELDAKVTHISKRNKDAILEQISMSELRLNRLDLSLFPYSDSMHQLLKVKGNDLTHFSLYQTDDSLNLDAVLTLGRCCPNLITLCLMTHSKWMVIPESFRRPIKIFSKLRDLTLREMFSFDHMLRFFLECTDNLERLVLDNFNFFNTNIISIDETLLHLLKKGHLRNVNYLWLDFRVSKDVVKRIPNTNVRKASNVHI